MDILKLNCRSVELYLFLFHFFELGIGETSRKKRNFSKNILMVYKTI